MSRKSLIIIILLVLVVGSSLFYFLLGGSAPTLETIKNNLPFGSAPSGETPFGEVEDTDDSLPVGTTEPISTSTRQLARFFKISDNPVAGAAAFARGTTTMVRYTDKATGHVYEVNMLTLERTKLLNTTNPQTYSAIWKADGTGYVTRGVEKGSDTITNTSVTLVPPTSTSTQAVYRAQTTLLRGTIGEIALTPNGGLLYNLEDSGAVITSNFTGGAPRTLFSLSFTNWRLQPATVSTALIYTKAAEGAAGYAYTLNLASGALTKILGPLASLTANISPDGRRLVFGHTSSNTPVFSALNIASGATVNIFPVTFPEKCAWSRKSDTTIYCGAPTGGLSSDSLALWHQGLTHFSDRIWKFDTSSAAATALVHPEKDFSTPIDATDLILGPSDEYLFLINKTDSSLWALKLVP